MLIKSIKLGFAVTSFILMTPLVAMLFTSEVNWEIENFAVAAMLLFVLVFTLSMLHKKIKLKKNRHLVLVIILMFFLLLWAELAVGIFNSPIAGN